MSSLYLVQLPRKVPHAFGKSHVSSVFLVVEPSKIIFLIKNILYPKGRIESYSIMGTIVSPYDKLLILRSSPTFSQSTHRSPYRSSHQLAASRSSPCPCIGHLRFSLEASPVVRSVAAGQKGLGFRV